MKQIQMPINWWIYNLILPYSYNKLAFTNKRNELLTHKTMCMNLKSILPNEWSQSKMETPCLFPKVKGQCLVTYSAVLLCCAKSLQLCLTLCSPVDCSPPGSFVHGILQARILEWVAVPSSMGSLWPRDGALISYISSTGRQVPYH